jgi:protein arginine kinase
VFGKVRTLKKGSFFRTGEIDALSQKFLMERHLISPEFMQGVSGRGLFIDDNEKISIMLNEEDHIRLQVISSGMSLNECWEIANKIDNELSRHIEYDFNDKFGYLTSCPTNVGTGLRASILIHLPGLVHTGEIDGVIANISKVGLAVRGFYGEGTDVLGNLFQISNQTTLGRTEEEIIDSLVKVTRKIIESEQSAQEKLMAEASDQIEDKVWRSYGILCYARVLKSAEVMNLLSALRLGLSLGLIDKFDYRELNELMIITQPAHLQKYVGKEMDNVERDMVRADLIRQRFNKSNES